MIAMFQSSAKRSCFRKMKKNMVFPLFICGALRDLVPFVQFKKREKHPWRSVTFSKVAGFSNVIFCVYEGITDIK